MDRRCWQGARWIRGVGRVVVIGVAMLALSMATPALASSAGGKENPVRVPAPASSNCEGPGCTDEGVVGPLLLLVGGIGTGCADGGVCLWTQDDFQGTKARVTDWPCCDWFQIPEIDRARSAKNRYGNRKVQTGNADHQTSCMDPGDNRPDIDASDRFRVGGLDSRCG
jgi:hypothetical protein